MKALIALCLLVSSTLSFAYGPKIDGWDKNFTLSEEVAADLIYDFYIMSVWWEDEGYECGGDFTEAKLLKVEDGAYFVEGFVTVVQDYCAYTTIANYVVKLVEVDGKFEVQEISFDEFYKD